MAEAADTDTSELAKEVVAELDTGTVIDDKIIVSKRGLLTLIGSGLSVGALLTLGVDETQAQQAAGQVGTSSEPVELFASNYDSTSVTGGFEVTIDGDTYQFNE